LPADIFRQIDSICEEFEAAWKSHRRPDVELFLAGAEEPVRTELLRELILLDVEYRQHAGETPTVDQYLGLFPEDVAFIQSLFETGQPRWAEGGMRRPSPSFPAAR